MRVRSPFAGGGSPPAAAPSNRVAHPGMTRFWKYSPLRLRSVSSLWWSTRAALRRYWAWLATRVRRDVLEVALVGDQAEIDAIIPPISECLGVGPTQLTLEPPRRARAGGVDRLQVVDEGHRSIGRWYRPKARSEAPDRAGAPPYLAAPRPVSPGRSHCGRRSSPG